MADGKASSTMKVANKRSANATNADNINGDLRLLRGRSSLPTIVPLIIAESRSTDAEI